MHERMRVARLLTVAAIITCLWCVGAVLYWWNAASTQLVLEGRIAEYEGDIAGAQRSFRYAAALPFVASASWSAPVYEGRLLYRQQQYDRSVALFGRSSLLWDHPAVQWYVGRSLSLRGNDEAAQTSFQVLVDDPLYEALGREELCLHQYRAGRLERAVVVCNEAIATRLVDEGNVNLRVHYALGLLLLGEDTAGARTHLETVLDAGLASRDRAERLVLVLSLLDEQPELQDDRFDIALVYALLDAHEVRAALRIADAVIDANSSYRDAHIARAAVRTIVGDAEGVAWDRARVLELDPIDGDEALRTVLGE